MQKCHLCNRKYEPHIFEPRTESDFFDYEKAFRNTNCHYLERCSRCDQLICDNCFFKDNDYCEKCWVICSECGYDIDDLTKASVCSLHYDGSFYICNENDCLKNARTCSICNWILCKECREGKEIKCICVEKCNKVV